jgi:M6 family metalloprotease-like protein
MSSRKRISLFVGIFVLIALITLSLPHSAFAAPINGFPVTVVQPDGTELRIFVSGDEFYNWLHDSKGYTIIQDPITGYYVYAQLVENQLVPTRFVVGVTDPSLVGLLPYLNISPEQRENIRQEALLETQRAAGEISNAPRTGTLNNLVIFIRFADESEFTDSTSTYTGMLNDTSAGANSMKNYFTEVSYGALTVDSGLYPTPPGSTIVSYQDSNPRGYFRPFNAITNAIGYKTSGERTSREHTLLRDAVDYVNALGQFPSGASIDADNDGEVDGVTFVISGSPDGWSELLWPHQWVLYSYDVRIDGKRVYTYSFHLQNFLKSSGTGVLAHEMFHALGAPDLYHYSQDELDPVGSWDVMESTANPPQHMGCYMKYTHGGWISSIPELTSLGTYTVNSLASSTDNCYRIPSPYSTTEYFVVENRHKTGTFESSIPGSGLLVYRINSTVAPDGNRNGPPDEVYIYRPGGTTTLNGNPNNANFSSNVGRTAINDATDPSSFLTDGSDGGLNICNIGASGATISFDICSGSAYSISGNAGVGGAVLSYFDGTPKTVTANGSGDYSIAVPSGWSGTVTPSKDGYTFDPASRSYTNVLANLTAQNYTASGSSNLLQDPSFEAYSPNPYWTETSTNFGTPLCTIGACGDGGGSVGPHTGSVWGWFGGVAADEIASLSQTVTIPAGTAYLEFYLWIGGADAGSDADDVFNALIDDVIVFSANATQTSSYSSYTLVSIDVSSYADDGTHTIMFESSTTTQVVNFNLDDVALISTTGSGPQVSSITRADPSPTNASSVEFTVTFSEPVTGVDVSDFSLTVTGVSSPSVSSVTDSGDQTTYTVSVNTGSGDGTIRLDLNPSGTGIQDLSGNDISGGYTGGETYELDRTAPSAPVISAPADASTTNDSTPTVSGTAEADSTVSIYIDGTLSGTTTTDGSGNWSFTLTSPLSDGEYTVKATATDVVGNISVDSSINTFTVDTTAPAAPVVTAPADASTTSDSTPTVSGTAEANSTVSVYIDGSLSGVTGADGSGDWSFTPASPLADGAHGVKATATDPAGNTSVDSSTNSFTVDTTAPGAPVVTAPADASTTNDSTPTVSGAAEADSTVNVYIDGSLSGVTSANGSGDWSHTPASPLADGAHSVKATATDSAGNTSSDSVTNTFTIDTTAPAAPVVTAPADASTTNDSTPTVSGTAEADSIVNVYIDGSLIGATTADGSGDWSHTPASALSDGIHNVKATATDSAGNTSVDSNTNTFTVDATPPAAPVVTAPPDASTTSDSTPTISGTAEADSTVNIYIDGSLIAATSADGSGDWSFTPASPLADGAHSVKATATDLAGNTSPDSSTNTFTVETAAPIVTSILRVDPNPTNALSVDFTLTFSEAVTGVDTSAPFNDFTLVTTGLTGESISAVSGSGDTYTVTLNTGSGDGSLRLDVNAGTDIQDQAGNPLDGGFSGGEVYDIDRTPPAVLSILRLDPSPTSSSTVRFEVTFSEAVTGVADGAFQITPTGSITGYAISGVSGSDDRYAVTVSTGMYNGTLRLDVNSSATGIQDIAGNSLSGGFTSGEVYTVEKTYTLKLKSQPKYDGWVLESGETTGVGGTKNHLGKILQLGDDTTDKQYRAILSFGTAKLPDNAVITKVILKVRKAAVVGTNPINTHNALVIDIKKAKFYTLPALQINDFQAKANKLKAGKFAKRLYSGWYRSVLYSGAFPYINKTGRTQFRLRFLLDDNDDNSADILKLYSGNALLSDRPQLIVQYYVP